MGQDYGLGCINCKRHINLGKFKYSENCYLIGENKFRRFLGLHSSDRNTKCRLIFEVAGNDDMPWDYGDMGEQAKDWFTDSLSLWPLENFKIYDSSKESLDETKLGFIEIGCLKCNQFIQVNNELYAKECKKDFENLHDFFCIHKIHNEIIVHFSSTQEEKIPWKNKKTSNNWTEYHWCDDL